MGQYDIVINIADHPTLFYGDLEGVPHPVKRRISVRRLIIDWDKEEVGIHIILEYTDATGNILDGFAPVVRYLPANSTMMIDDDNGGFTSFWDKLMATTSSPQILRNTISFYVNVNSTIFD